MTPELIALLRDTLRLRDLERIFQKGALYNLRERMDAHKEAEEIEDRIRAALAEAQKQHHENRN